MDRGARASSIGEEESAIDVSKGGGSGSQLGNVKERGGGGALSEKKTIRV